MSKRTSATSRESLNAIVDQFESGWSSATRIEDFLPDETDPEHSGVLCELIRIDMELRWSANEARQLSDYLEQFAMSSLSRAERSELAFEEFRLRKQHGDFRSPDYFSQTYGIDVANWPSGSENGTSAKGTHVRPAMPRSGQTFHGFELAGVLGKGAFGNVYLAQQSDLANRFVVIKVTAINDVEPQALAKLQHTNIVPIHSLRREDGLQSICMPFMGLVTLRDILRIPDSAGRLTRSGKALVSTIAGKRASTISKFVSGFSADEDASAVMSSNSSRAMINLEGMNYQEMMLWMAGRVADGLAYSHLRGVVHGDLKPGNILIADDGQPLILDFHLSTHNQQQKESSLAGGTLPYMSVRHLKTLDNEMDVDESCDLFSLGAVLYEALTGQLPFPNRGAETFSLGEMIHDRQQPPRPVRSVNPMVAPGFASIVEKCLSPAAPYSSADQIRIDLERHQADLPLRFAANPSSGERLKKWSRRHPKLSSVSAMVALGVVILGTIALLVGSRLRTAAITMATQESSEFIARLEESAYPLTVGGTEVSLLRERSELLNGILDDYLDESVDGKNRYSSRLKKLNPEQIEKESAAVVEAEYWLARSYYVVALNSPESERESFLNRAVAELETAVEKTGTRPGLLRLQSDIESELGNDEKSRQLLRQSEHAEGQRQDGYLEQLYRAGELSIAGRAAEALPILEQLSQTNPLDFQVWLLKGHAYRQQHEAPDAIACFTVCIGLRPESSWGHFFRGVSRLDIGDFKSARTDFDRALELDETSAGRMNRALALQGLGEFKAAIDDVTAVIENGCTETRAYYIRHRLLEKTGEQQKAQTDLQTFLELEPSDEKSWLSRGMAQMQVRNPERALADFQSALELNPDSIKAYQNIATVEAEFLDQTENAIDALTSIVNAEPNNVVAIATRGVLYARSNNKEMAHDDAELALSMSQSADTCYRVAGIFALTSVASGSDKTTALSLLQQAAFANGRLVSERIGTDADLDPLRKTVEFRELIETLNSWKH